MAYFNARRPLNARHKQTYHVRNVQDILSYREKPKSAFDSNRDGELTFSEQVYTHVQQNFFLLYTRLTGRICSARTALQQQAAV